MDKKDINWINLVKAICMLLVFLWHCENYYGERLGWIDGLYRTIYVNAFFFVSGYLLFWKQLSEPKISENGKQYLSGSGRSLMMNVLYRIIIPSIIFSTIEFFPSCMIQNRGIDVGYAFYKTIGGGTYWFTSALAVAEIILFLLFCTRKKNICFYAIISFALGVWGLVIVRLGILQNGIWAWRQGLIALIFLAMGGFYWRYEKQVDKLMRWWCVLPLLIVYMVMVLGLREYNNPLISTLTIQPFGFVTSAMACLLLVWLCKKLPEVKLLTFIGRNSLGFYFMSGALPITFSMVAHKIMVSSNVWTMIVIWGVCVFVSFIAVMVINRWLPWLWDFRKITARD